MKMFTCSVTGPDKQMVVAVMDDGRTVVMQRPMGIIEECIEEIHSDSWQVLVHGKPIVPVVSPTGLLHWSDITDCKDVQLATLGRLRQDPLFEAEVRLYMAVLRHEFE